MYSIIVTVVIVRVGNNSVHSTIKHDTNVNIMDEICLALIHIFIGFFFGRFLKVNVLSKFHLVVFVNADVPHVHRQMVALVTSQSHCPRK